MVGGIDERGGYASVGDEYESDGEFATIEFDCVDGSFD